MSPYFIASIICGYFLFLLFIAWLTSRKADNATFFIGNKRSPWYLVAFGMIGASLSGVTFISVPGWVGNSQFTYMALVVGYFFGYVVIATVLMPLYYRLNLTSIYTYLDQRFGNHTYKTGASFFILSRTIGASFRMFLVVNVLQIFLFDAWGIHFAITTLIFIIFILLYTIRGGVRTIIYTDTLQTVFMLAAVVISVIFMMNELDFTLTGLVSAIRNSHYSNIFDTNISSERYFLKQFFSGAFISIVMTGLDQEMMQKNLSCRNIRDAQKNMFSFSFVLIFVNLLFLTLGAVLYIFALEKAIPIPERSDNLFPVIALQYLGPVAGVVFLIGIISAAFPSADGALTSLTTSFTIDILGKKPGTDDTEKKLKATRQKVHLSFAALFLVLIVVFRAINNSAVIEELFRIAGYTYGPLLGLYAFGLFSHRPIRDKWAPYIAVVSPVICYGLSILVPRWTGYHFGFELLILNGLLTYLGLFFISKPGAKQ